MKQGKRQTNGVICATVLTVIAMFGFRLIASSYAGGFGEFAKEAAQLAIAKQFDKVVTVLLISTIALCVIGFTKPKLIKPLYVIWGILICAICFAVCMRTAKYPFFDGAPEVQTLAVIGTRFFAFALGIIFPVLHLILCVESCGDSLKDNLINQGITILIFLLLFLIFTRIVSIIVNEVYQGITVAACLAAVITIFPALNMGNIRQQINSHRH